MPPLFGGLVRECWGFRDVRSGFITSLMARLLPANEGKYDLSQNVGYKVYNAVPHGTASVHHIRSLQADSAVVSSSFATLRRHSL